MTRSRAELQAGPSALGSLAAWITDDADDGRQLLADFAHSLEVDLGRVVAAADSRDRELARALVHRIGGSSSMFGANRVADLCQKVTQEMKAGAQLSDGRLQDLKTEVEAAVATIEEVTRKEHPR